MLDFISLGTVRHGSLDPLSFASHLESPTTRPVPSSYAMADGCELFLPVVKPCRQPCHFLTNSHELCRITDANVALNCRQQRPGDADYRDYVRFPQSTVLHCPHTGQSSTRRLLPRGLHVVAQCYHRGTGSVSISLLLCIRITSPRGSRDREVSVTSVRLKSCAA
jgi:hypothetical protein